MKAPVYFVLSLVLLCLSGWSTGAKPGECPKILFKPAQCDELCSNDKDCPEDEKCCKTVCGTQCMAPIKVKPGECPPTHLGEFGKCDDFCFNDGDCPGEEKCCSNGCGHECTAPYTGK